MKISLDWLKSYVKTSLPVEQITDILTDIGLEVEGVETVAFLGGGLQGLVIGHVTSCVPHPDADKLQLTTVDIGEKEDLQIVCGAPNVALNQKVVVATVGTTLYPIKGDEFKIKKAKVRGATSEGMICAEDEIGLGESHAGIMVLDQDAPEGMPAADYFNSIGGYNGQKVTDTLIEIGLTPNRSDATGHLGVAFDLAAALQINFPGEGSFERPHVSNFAVQETTLPISVAVKDTIRCPRYSGVCIKGVKVAESPKWLKGRLEAIGLTPKNNIVDITNFVLHELGQPLHAFDYEKIADHKVIVQSLAAGTKFTTLDEVERELLDSDLMICDGKGEGMCIAGVFGGEDSGVKAETVNVFLESAYFDAKSIRKTSMHHLLRTDAATRYEKGTDPNITIYALQRAALLIQQEAGGVIASEVIDVYPTTIPKVEVTLKYHHVRRLIGEAIPVADIKAILAALEMNIIEENEQGLTIAIPTNKADVLREVDVIEEILRIYGYNRIEASTTLQSNLAFAPKPDAMKVRNRVGEWLATAGFHEMMNLSISASAYYKNILPTAEEELVYINNTSNQNLDLMRPDMLFGGLEVILHNQNYQVADAQLFEFGKTYHPKGEAYKEVQHLSLFLCGQHQGASWLNVDKKAVSFYTLKAQVQNLMAKLGVDLGDRRRFRRQIIEHKMPWAYALEIAQGKQVVLTMGRVHPEVAFEMGIKKPVFYADINWDFVLNFLKKHKVVYQPIPKYPSMRRDLALVVDKSVTFEQIIDVAEKQGKKLLKEANLFDVYENEEQLGENKKSYAVSFLFQNEEKTLKDKEVDKVMNKLMKTYENELNALIRK